MREFRGGKGQFEINARISEGRISDAHFEEFRFPCIRLLAFIVIVSDSRRSISKRMRKIPIILCPPLHGQLPKPLAPFSTIAKSKLRKG